MRLKKLPGALLLLVTCVALLASCIGGGGINTGTTAGGTTPLDEASAAAFAALITLTEEGAETRADSRITYDDPAIGKVLSAETSLIRDSIDSSLVCFNYGYDSLNPAGAAEFTSRITGTSVGTVTEVAEDLSGMYGWVVGTAGFSLSGLALHRDSFSSLSVNTVTDGSSLLTGTVKNDQIRMVFGSALGGATGLTLTVSFTESEVTEMCFSYTLGTAEVQITTVFSYEPQTVTAE